MANRYIRDQPAEIAGFRVAGEVWFEHINETFPHGLVWVCVETGTPGKWELANFEQDLYDLGYRRGYEETLAKLHDTGVQLQLESFVKEYRRRLQEILQPVVEQPSNDDTTDNG